MRYSYDGLNRLAREDNSLLDKTFLYEYDLAGNITKVTECAYTLSDSLTPVHILTYAYDSRQQLTGITGLPALNASSGNCSVSGYDAAGNPLSYRGASLNWFRGRMLKNCILPNNTSITYAYDSNGIRISKTVNDTTHTYFTEGSRIRAEKRTYGQTSPETPVVLPLSDVYTYIYDASGITGMSLSPSGASSSSAAYFFLKNQQGDIKFIVDGNGNTLNEYVYDAWGNHKIYKYLNGTILTDSSETPIDISSHSDYTNDIGNINPFRYRGYYFDAETGWYYLNSRYYDPQTRRFLNADDPSVPLADQATLFGGLNLYSYCLNNPVMYVDPTGCTILSVLLVLAVSALAGSIVGLGAQFAGDLITSFVLGEWHFSSLEEYIGSTIGGSIGGMLSLIPGFGFGAAVVGGTIGTFAGLALCKLSGSNNMSWGDIALQTLVSLSVNLATAGLVQYARIPGITSGSHSFNQVWKSGVTKVFEHGMSMSLKTAGKGFISTIVSNFGVSFLASAGLQGFINAQYTLQERQRKEYMRKLYPWPV